MDMLCTATVHTNLEIYWTAVVELLCTHSTVSLHFNNYVATFLATNVKIKLYLADKLAIADKFLTIEI